MAKLGWTNQKGPGNCYGMILDEDTVITVADCAAFNGIPVDTIVEPSFINISKIHIHPRYKKGSSYDNIAVLKLSSLLQFGPGVQYSCIWTSHNWEDATAKVTGTGRADLVKALLQDLDIKIDPTPIMVHSDNYIRNASSCIISDRYLDRMQYGIANEHVCLGNDYFLVPETCDLLIGAPLGYAALREGKYYQHSLGLIQFGRDCGFGEHMIATRLASHVGWLSSVLLPDYFSYSGNFVFLNDNLIEGDSCKAHQEKPGRCVSVAECSDDWRRLIVGGSMSFCSTASLICCPLDALEKNFHPVIDTELERCPVLHRGMKFDFPLGYLVEISEDAKDKVVFRCLGSIIARNLVVTTARCLKDTMQPTLKTLSNGLTLSVTKKTIHDSYNATDNTNDIALIKLSEKLTWSSNLYPACLWLNRTHTPLVMKLIQTTEESVVFQYALPMYNTDCQRTHPLQLRRSQLCVKSPSGAAKCVDAGSVLHSEADDDVVKYLVGMAQSNEYCQSQRYPTFTRISAMVDWIKRFLDSDVEN